MIGLTSGKIQRRRDLLSLSWSGCAFCRWHGPQVGPSLGRTKACSHRCTRSDPLRRLNAPALTVARKGAGTGDRWWSSSLGRSLTAGWGTDRSTNTRWDFVTLRYEDACVPLIGGEGGIRTLDRLLTYTHFPGVLLKPLGHLSGRLQCLSAAWGSDSGPDQKRLPQALRAGKNIRNRRYGANPAGPGSPALPAAASPRPIWTEPNRRRPAPQSPHDPPQEHRPG